MHTSGQNAQKAPFPDAKLFNNMGQECQSARGKEETTAGEKRKKFSWVSFFLLLGYNY